MNSNLKNNKGIVLFLVLSVIMLVIVLANIILMIVRSQSRLTHHQISRIRAYYAAQAGRNYALEMLRLGTWTVPTAAEPNPQTRRICSAAGPGCNLVNSGLPYDVIVRIYRTGWDPPSASAPAIAGSAPIEIFVDYRYAEF